jgi:CheY-like chemotaxis protein
MTHPALVPGKWYATPGHSSLPAARPAGGPFDTEQQARDWLLCRPDITGATVWQAPPTDAARLRVLVAHDDADAAESLRILVSLWGHDARTAASANEALAVARAFAPHVALIETAMSGGKALPRQLRTEPGFAEVMLVALETGGTHPRAGHEFDYRLPLPVDPVALERLLVVRLDP